MNRDFPGTRGEESELLIQRTREALEKEVSAGRDVGKQRLVTITGGEHICKQSKIKFCKLN